MNNPRVVVVGSGFGGLETAFYLRHRLGKRADITVVSENDYFLFKPNTIYIPFGKKPESFYHPVAHAFEKRHIDFKQTRANNVDPKSKALITDDGEVPYDYLVLATGATMRPNDIPGLADNAATIWNPDEMMKVRAGVERIEKEARAGKKQRVLYLAPPGNKCSGPLYEMVFMLDSHLRREKLREKVDITWASFEHTYIQAFGKRLHAHVIDEFAKRSITGHLEWPIDKVEPGKAVFKNGETLEFDLLISFPPYAAAQVFEGLERDDRGFLTTNHDTRQLAGQEDIYAVGDAGDFPVKQAFLALLQADAVGEHISQRVLHEEPTAKFDPVSMCIMEQFNKATFAQVPLRVTGNAEYPVEVRQESLDMYKVGSGKIWRVGKKMLGAAMPHAFHVGKPFHAGPTWKMMEAGLVVMEAAFAE
ncbi:MAG: FAD-dependent oxidoreductase [Planctomycetes bacterium]|nr:FAD-dependent oxidoreductase [Planctomycetota bacterium]